MDGQRRKVPLPGRNGREKRAALGADRRGIGGVFDVAAAENRAVRT